MSQQGSPASGPGCDGAATPKVGLETPSPHGVRRLLDAVLPTDADLDAFGIDFFPEARREWSGSMERSRKVTLLLSRNDPGLILRRLRQWSPDRFEQHWCRIQKAEDAQHLTPAWTLPRRRFLLRRARLLTMTVLGICALGLVGFFWFKRRERLFQTVPSDPMHALRLLEDAAPLREMLDASLVRNGDPVAPESCQEHAPEMLRSLTRASTALLGARVLSRRPQDIAALGILRGMQVTTRAPSSELWVLLCRAYLATEADPEPAYQAARQAVTSCPSYALAHNLLGNAEQLRRNWGAAAAAYRRAVRLDPQFLAPRINLGTALLHEGKAAAAVAELDEVLRRAADHGDARHARGLAYLALGSGASAVADLEVASDEMPDSSDVWQSLGDAFEQTGQRRKAHEAYCIAARLGSTEAGLRCRAVQETSKR